MYKVNGIYFIMHENRRIGIIDVKDCAIVNVIVNDKYLDYFPVGFKLNKRGLLNWLDARSIPATRYDLKTDLGSLSKFEFMIANLGLSLTDHYWLLPETSYLTWETVNLYTNQFRSTFSLSLDKDIIGKTNFTPSASLKGDLRKKWIIDENGVRRLVKGNYNNSCRQSICEVFASELHRLQGKFTYAPYSLIRISSEGKIIIGCECPNFTDIYTEFVSAYDLLNMPECNRAPRKTNDMNWYAYYIQYTNSLGLDLQDFMDYMFMIDFVMTNVDRHLNNFGVLRDSTTLQYKGYAPIFDSGNSLFYNSSYIPVDKGLLNIEVTSFRSREVEMLSLVRNRGVVNLSCLPSENYLYQLLKFDNTSDEHIERTIKAYNRKIQYLYEFQNGADLWKYSRKRGR